MLALSYSEIEFIGLCLEGFFYGLYSAIFGIFLLQIYSIGGGRNRIHLVFYTLCLLYVLIVASVVIDITNYMNERHKTSSLLLLAYTQTTLNGCCNFISQSILIYRCWIVWGCDIRIVILPSILAFIFIVSWLAVNAGMYITPDGAVLNNWGSTLCLTSLTISLAVNTLVTGLIVFKIFKVYREVQPNFVNGGSNLRSVIFILIESGMALFAVQFIRLVLTAEHADRAYALVYGTYQMFNGITPTIIMVRVSMGLSFHNEKSMTEVTGSVHFATHADSAFAETCSSPTAFEDSTGGDTVVQLSTSDIDTVSR